MDEVECHVKMMIALYQTGWMHGTNSTTKLKIAQVHNTLLHPHHHHVSMLLPSCHHFTHLVILLSTFVFVIIVINSLLLI